MKNLAALINVLINVNGRGEADVGTSSTSISKTFNSNPILAVDPQSIIILTALGKSAHPPVYLIPPSPHLATFPTPPPISEQPQSLLYIISKSNFQKNIIIKKPFIITSQKSLEDNSRLNIKCYKFEHYAVLMIGHIIILPTQTKSNTVYKRVGGMGQVRL